MKLRLHCTDIAATREALCKWYAGRLGRILYLQESECLNTILQNLFGYHLLQVGCPSADNLLNISRVGHHAVLDAYPVDGRVPDIYGFPDSLPVASDSIDVVLLPHTLEFEHDPHEILREIERVLIPEGHVVIMAFNPWSLWGLWHLIRRRRGVPPWCGRFMGLTRIKDWLALLGFDTVLVRPIIFRPPLKNEAIMRRLQFMERSGNRFWPLLAAVNIIVAKKRVATVTPIKPRWRPRRSSLVPNLAKPTNRSVRGV